MKLILWIALALNLLAPMTVLAADTGPGLGSLFPEVSLPVPQQVGAGEYLGIDDTQQSFTLSQVAGDVVLVELLNVHCPHCQMQTYSYNELFTEIEKNPASRGHIRMLGIAAGNLPDEVETFRQRYQVRFPVIADPKFTIWRAVGGSATPVSLYVRQTRPGSPGVIAAVHLGLNTQYTSIQKTLLELAGQPPEDLIRQGVAAEKVRRAIEPLFSDQELEYRVRVAIINTGGGIIDFSPLNLRSGRRVYAARLRQGDSVRQVFAEVVSRLSVCDICHDVHFIYVFDPATRIIGFEPLQLTKYGNVNWNAEEIAKMRRRLLGSYLTAPPAYDPKVDAISSATITSAIIFDSIDQSGKLVEELRAEGLLKP